MWRVDGAAPGFGIQPGRSVGSMAKFYEQQPDSTLVPFLDGQQLRHPSAGARFSTVHRMMLMSSSVAGRRVGL